LRHTEGYDSAPVKKADALAVANRRHTQRGMLLGQEPVTLWLTGLSGAGKTTLAVELGRKLIEAKHPTFMLDGDNIRKGLCRDLGFGPDDRHENIRRVAEVARLMNDAGLIVISAFISPYRADREMAGSIIGKDHFIEAYVDAPLEVCERRDPKGLYRKARRGEIADFTGISAPYEPPTAPSVIVRTAESSIEDCASRLFQALIYRIRLKKR
jgi:adenylyl-sulfate kinase